MSPRHQHAGFSLLELMMVVVLLGLVASVGVSGLSAGSEAARMRQCLALLENLDTRLRIHAAQSGEHLLSVRDDGRAFLVRNNRDSERTETVALPEGCRVELLDPATLTPLPNVRFTRLGESGDYCARFSSRSSSRMWRIAGLTGWLGPLDPEAAR